MDLDVSRILPFVAVGLSLFALYAKWQEKPRLNIRLKPSFQAEGGNGGMRWRFVHLAVQNPRSSRPVRWLTYRQPARGVRLELQYFAENGSLPKFEFEGRWSGNPQPYQEKLVNGEIQKQFDPWLVQMGRYRDVAAGAEEDVAVAIKVGGDADCFGFTNESYLGANAFRLDEYRLPTGAYRVVATAVSGELRSSPAAFLLHNDGKALTDLWLDTPRS